MNFSRNEVSSIQRYGGISIVALLHALAAYAIISHLAYNMIDTAEPPLVIRIVKEIKQPPPDETPAPSPKIAMPSLPFIPPPDVKIDQPVPQEQAITSFSVERPQPQTAEMKIDAPKAPEASLPTVQAHTNLNSCAPLYSSRALLNEEEGVVQIRFEVGPDDQLKDVIILKSSGHKDLDRDTVNALSRCKFRAGFRNGKPVASVLTANYVWKLDNGY